MGGPASDSGADLALVALARRGDRAAFETIVRANASAVYRVVLGFVPPREADDVAQDVFLRVVQGLGSYDGRARLGTWICAIATNVALNHVRSRRRKPPPASLPESAPVPAATMDPGDAALASEERAALERALATLPEEQRAVVALRIHGGLAFEEVAAALGIPRATAESRMARAKAALRGIMRPLVQADDEARSVSSAKAVPGRDR